MVRKRHPDRVEAPALDIQVTAKADSVRFEDAPETDVEITGEAEDRTSEEQPEIEGGSASERENLPDEVEPGVTYRDVRVRWRAAARFADPDD